ncbi:MAG: XdhC family protein [Chromatiaceae bacterium]
MANPIRSPHDLVLSDGLDRAGGGGLAAPVPRVSRSGPGGPVESSPPASSSSLWCAEMEVTGEEIFGPAREWRGSGKGVALATVVRTWGSSPRPIGSHLAVNEAGAFVGSVSGGCLEAIVSAQAARRPVATVTRLADGTQALWQEAGLCGELELPSAAAEEIARRIVADRSGLLEADEGLFLRVYVPVPRLLVVGAVHIAQALAPMAATAGFAVVVIDPRRAFASSARFPGVLLRHEWPDQALAELRPDAATAVVSLTHDPKLADPALAAALTRAAFYSGSLGSTRTHARRLERLRCRCATGAGRKAGRLSSRRRRGGGGVGTGDAATGARSPYRRPGAGRRQVQPYGRAAQASL